MNKPFNIHDWQAKQRLSEENNPVVAKGDGLEITQDEMEKLHKNGRVKLKNGSVLVTFSFFFLAEKYFSIIFSTVL